MRSIGESFQLFYTFWKVSIGNFFEECCVKKRFYQNAAFKGIDRKLLKSYQKTTPYQVSKEFLMKKGEKEIHVYGETYLTTMAAIAKKAAITEADNVLEMGCGRGRASFFLHSHFGCHVHGIDWIPTFVEKASSLAKLYCLPRIQFSCLDMEMIDFQKEDFAKITCIYLYGTCLQEETVASLVKKFTLLPKGTKIVTVSYSLLDYIDSSTFHLKDRFRARYPWGYTDIFLHEVK